MTSSRLSCYNKNMETRPFHRRTTYRIRLRGHLDTCWSDWFDGFSISYPAQGETLLRGTVADQAALHGLLAKVRDLGLVLLAVESGGNTEEAT